MGPESTVAVHRQNEGFFSLSSPLWLPPPQPVMLLLQLTPMELMDIHMELMELTATPLPQQPTLLPQLLTSTHTIMPDKYTQLLNHTFMKKLLLNHTSTKKLLLNHTYTSNQYLPQLPLTTVPMPSQLSPKLKKLT